MDAGHWLILIGWLLFAAAVFLVFVLPRRAKPQDGLAVLACIMSFWVLMLHTEFLLAITLGWPRIGSISRSAVLVMLAYVAFFSLFAFVCLKAWRRRKCHPDKWRGRGYLITATAILFISLLQSILVIICLFLDDRPKRHGPIESPERPGGAQSLFLPGGNCGDTDSAQL